MTRKKLQKVFANISANTKTNANILVAKNGSEPSPQLPLLKKDQNQRTRNLICCEKKVLSCLRCCHRYSLTSGAVCLIPTAEETITHLATSDPPPDVPEISQQISNYREEINFLTRCDSLSPPPTHKPAEMFVEGGKNFFPSKLKSFIDQFFFLVQQSTIAQANPSTQGNGDVPHKILSRRALKLITTRRHLLLKSFLGLRGWDSLKIIMWPHRMKDLLHFCQEILNHSQIFLTSPSICNKNNNKNSPKMHLFIWLGGIWTILQEAAWV